MENSNIRTPEKLPYEAPALVREGSLAELTRTGTGLLTDVGGLGSGA